MARSTQDILFRFTGDSKSLEAASRRSRGALDKTDTGARKAAGGVGLLGKAAIAAGAAFVTANFVRFGQEAIAASSDYTESMNAVEMTSGEAADAIIALGNEAAQSFGLSKTAVNEAAVAFSSFGKNIDTDGDISDTFEEFLLRATDFASVMNIDVVEALRIFQSTLAGETEPIRRFGKDISAAAVALHAVETGIVDSAKAMTEAEKQQARYSLLMQETADVAGDFENTSGELAGQQKILTAEWEHAKIALGDALVPAMSAAIPLLTGLAREASSLNKDLALGTSLWDELASSVRDFTEDATFGLIENKHAWDATDESMQAVARQSKLLKERFDEGATATEAASTALGAMATGMSELSETTLKALQEQLGLSADEMRVLIAATQRSYEEAGFAATAFDDTAAAAYLMGLRVGEVPDNLYQVADAAGAAARATRGFKADAEKLDALLAGTVFGLEFKTNILKDFSGTIASGGFNHSGATRAHGGPINAGQPTLVGERGPEVITSSRGGFVTPNHKLSSGGNQYTINVTAIDPAAAAEAVADAIRLYESTNGPISG